MGDYSKVAERKANTPKSTVFLRVNREQVEFEIKNKMLFTLAPKGEEDSGINLTACAPELHEDNCEVLM